MGILRAIGKALVGMNPDCDDFDPDCDEIDSEDEFAGTNNISFGHAPNDGSYTRTSKDVSIQVAGGNDKGPYDVFLHHGQKYIDFQNQWINIEGKTRFFLNGNTYIIK